MSLAATPWIRPARLFRAPEAESLLKIDSSYLHMLSQKIATGNYQKSINMIGTHESETAYTYERTMVITMHYNNRHYSGSIRHAISLAAMMNCYTLFHFTFTSPNWYVSVQREIHGLRFIQFRHFIHTHKHYLTSYFLRREREGERERKFIFH